MEGKKRGGEKYIYIHIYKEKEKGGEKKTKGEGEIKRDGPIREGRLVAVVVMEVIKVWGKEMGGEKKCMCMHTQAYKHNT